jgi:hypothetical protein
MNVREAVDRVVAVCSAKREGDWRTILPDPLSESKGRSTREHIASLPFVHRGDGCVCTGCMADLHYALARNASERLDYPGETYYADEAKWYQEFADALFLLHKAQSRESADRDVADLEAGR